MYFISILLNLCVLYEYTPTSLGTNVYVFHIAVYFMSVQKLVVMEVELNPAEREQNQCFPFVTGESKLLL